MHFSSFRIFTLLICAFIYLPAYMQGVKGRLTDSKQNPVPFAAVYDETTYIGTTSNADGYYDLKLPAGKHALIYKALGYFVERRNVETTTTTLKIDLLLKEQAFELKDVVVTPGKEDPAYAIMRKAISRAPYHLNQVKEYKADVYMRGTINIIHIPKFIAKHTEINGKKNVLKSGDVYIEESLNVIKFTAPDKYDQNVKSFRTTFPGENSVSPMQIIRASFYQPKIEETISPLASNALNFYKYRYEGYSTEGEFTVFKIKVTPKHNSQQLLSGYIYIIDKLWCLHSVDVAQEMFFGKLKYKEIFSPIKNNAWLPISYLFNVNAAIMGVKADYKYTSSVKYQDVVLNEKNISKPAKIAEAKDVPDKKPITKADPKTLKKQQELEKLITKENLTNREMIKLASIMAKEAPNDTAKTRSLEIKDEHANVVIEKDAMKNDSSYWNTIRPIPLTTVESGIKTPRDSISLTKKDTINGKDSIAIGKKKNLGKVGRIVFGGAEFNAIPKILHVKYNGLIGFKRISFNTVDGFVYNQTVDLRLKIDSVHNLNIRPGIAYAFSRETFQWWTDVNYEYAPLKRGNISLNYSNNTSDFNRQGGMHNQLNSLTSLFFRQNYIKYYQQHQASVSNSIDLANGLYFTSAVGFRYEKPLVNNSDFSFFYRDSREFTSNLPVKEPEALQYNAENKEAYAYLKLEYTPEHYYRVRNGRKRYQSSKYPTFFASYKKAIPGIANSNADFDYLEVGARQTKNWGMMHSFSWNLTAGQYLNKKHLFLSDYKFFSNQPLPVIFGNAKNSFMLADLYENYTNKGFAEGHVTFSTPYLLLKYLPFLSNKMWLENLHLNYLYTGKSGNYWETGYSVSQIYLIGSVGVYAGFKDNKFQSAGVKVSINFQ